MPILFSIFDKYDSVNCVVLTKTFSGDNGGSLTNAKIWDSIYFKEALIKAVLWRSSNDMPGIFQKDTFLLTDEVATGKEPGIFAYPKFKQYVLRKNLVDYFGYSLVVEIPGYQFSPLYQDFTNSPELILPDNQLTITADLAMFIRWRRLNSSADDMRIDFMIDTYSIGKVIRDTITYSRFGIIPHDNPLPYGQASFSYPQLLGLLNSKFKNNNIDYRQITGITVKITSARGLGASELSNDYLNYFTPDVTNYNPNSLGYSIMASKASTSITGLKIDPSNIAAMNENSEFAKFRIVQWQPD